MSETSNSKAALVVSAIAGAIFSVGLVLSGMLQPSKVIGFLDVGGAWDPSLAFVMGGAIAVHAVACRIAQKRSAPVFAPTFALTPFRTIDARLLLGSAIFGAGWGLGGFCPGPGIAALGTFGLQALVFVGAMALGLFVVSKFDRQA